VYRSAGNIEGRWRGSGSGDKIQNTMKSLKSMRSRAPSPRFYGSEMLDFVVDEAVQIFGGYGFHEEYPCAARTRFAHSTASSKAPTNQPHAHHQMLMKRAMGGQLPLIPAAMKLADEILAARPSKKRRRCNSPPSPRRRQLQENVSASGRGAVQRFREKLPTNRN